MCEICGQYFHHPACPLAPEPPKPPVFAHCDLCDEPIYDGDEYYELDDHKYCEACVQGGYRTAEVYY